MTNVVLLSFIALAFFATETVLHKLTAKYVVKNPLTFNFYLTLFEFIFVLPSLFSNQITFPSLIDFKYIFLTSLTITIAMILYFFVLYHIDASVIGPLYNFRIFFSILLSTIFLHEILNPTYYLWIGILTIGGFFVTFNEKTKLKSFFQKPVFIFLIYVFGLALMSIFINKGVNISGYWNFTFWYKVISFILVLFTIPFFKKDFKVSRKQFSTISIISLIGFLGTLFANQAFSINVTIPTAIFSIPGSMIIIFILSRLKPDLLEKHSLKVYTIRFFAASIMIFAAFQLK